MTLNALDVRGVAPAQGVSVTFVVTENTLSAIDLTPFCAFATSLYIASGPSHGAVATAGLVLTYNPTTNYTGSDLVTWQAVGPGGNSTTVNLNIIVAAPGATALAGGTGPLAWSTPTAWAASTAYIVGPPASCVTYNGSTYVCSTAHTSSGSFDPTKWTVIAMAGAAGGTGTTGPAGPRGLGPLVFATYASLIADTTDAVNNNGAWVVNDTIGTTSSRARASNVATIVTAAAHGLSIGNAFNLSGQGGTGYNGRWTVASVPNSTTITFANTGGNESTTSDTGGTLDRNGVFTGSAGSWTFAGSLPASVAAESARAIAAETAETARAEAAEAPLTAVVASYLDTSVTTGGTPSASYVNPYTGCCTSNNVLTTNTVDKLLQSITFNCVTVGDGTAWLSIFIAGPSAGSGPVVGSVHITGITATGVQTANAGATSGPTFAAGHIVPPGAETFLGSASGGAVFGSTVSIGNGRILAYNVTIYAATPSVGNVISGHQVSLAYPTTVQSSVAPLQASARAAVTISTPDDYVTEYDAPSYINLYGTGASVAFPLGCGIPFKNSGSLSVKYVAATTGTLIFQLWRATAFDGNGQPSAGYMVASFPVTVTTTGSVQTATPPSPINAQGGTDFLMTLPVTAQIQRVSWSNPNGIYPASVADYAGASFTTVAYQPAVVGVITRPKTPRELDVEAGRVYKTVANPSFASLPATGWTATGAWTVSSGELVAPTASSVWTNTFLWNYNDASNRRKWAVRLRFATTTAVAGVVWNYGISTVNGLGTIAAIDASAGASSAVAKVYACNYALGSPSLGYSVAIPWTINTTDTIIYEGKKHRGKITHTWTNMTTGQSVQIVTLPVVHASPGGNCQGQMGVAVYSGDVRFQRIGIEIPVVSQIILMDSNGDGTIFGESYARSWPFLIEDARGKADLLICSCAGASSADGVNYATTALLASPNAKIINGLGVNPDNAGGSTDAQRYAKYVSDHTSTAALTSGGYAIVTPPPYSSLSGYVALCLAGVQNGSVIAGVEYANLTNPPSTSYAGAAFQSNLTIDGLHFNLAGASVAQAVVQNQIASLS